MGDNLGGIAVTLVEGSASSDHAASIYEATPASAQLLQLTCQYLGG
jgi:hypothetical protein